MIKFSNEKKGCSDILETRFQESVKKIKIRWKKDIEASRLGKKEGYSPRDVE